VAKATKLVRGFVLFTGIAKSVQGYDNSKRDKK
jgi:hypothetical protein